VAGAYQLVAEEFDSLYGEAPWILVRAEGRGCEAVVACERNLGRAYDATIANGSLHLSPRGPAAVGGGSDPIGYHRSEWNAIALRATAAGLTGPGTANVRFEYDEEDVWDSWQETVELSVEEPTQAALGAAISGLPWSGTSVYSSRPVEELASYLVLPSPDWTANDRVDPNAVGVISSSVDYAGNWDALRGRRVEIGVEPNLTDLAGLPLSTTTLETEVRDIGPAVAAHDFHDTSTVATWGNVEPFLDGDCATSGCISILGGCGRPEGVAGQIDPAGMEELVLSMRLADFDDPPDGYFVEVVGADGTRIPPTSGGDWIDPELHEWTYDIAGEARVGFLITASAACHGWGGPIVVDRVFAR
jgi:hypothetical protein